ncbi:MAG: hypothetical protein AAF702_38425 [Chloroflexota bacterium]
MNTETPPPITKGTPFHFGEYQFHFGDEIVELVDSSPIRDDVSALKTRMAKDGYLFIRGFHDWEKGA